MSDPTPLRTTPPDPDPPRPTTSLPAPVPSDVTLRQLREEIDAAEDSARIARLLGEAGEIAEREGDDAAAARDYFAAADVDPTFREPLEGIGRLLVKRATLKGLEPRFVESTLAAAVSADERVRALLLRSAYLSDVGDDLAEAIASARAATEIAGASTAERARAWLELEVLAGRMGDGVTREQALGQRAAHTADPTWKALLRIDQARLVAESRGVDGALGLLAEARALESGATWSAATTLETLARDPGGLIGASDARARTQLRADALVGVAELIDLALADPARGDALGVPRWARDPARSADAWLRAADTRRLSGDVDGARTALARAREAVAHLRDEDAACADAVVTQAQLRVAEQSGKTHDIVNLSTRRLETERDPALVAALTLRVAEIAAGSGDLAGAAAALDRVLAADPDSVPGRALELEVLADDGDPLSLGARLEHLAERFTSEAARARAYLVAAYVYAARAADPGRARAAAGRAARLGIDAEAAARFSRMLAVLTADKAWYADATLELLGLGVGVREAWSLVAEQLRDRAAGDAVDAPVGDGEPSTAAWLTRVVEAFSPLPAAAPAETAHHDTDRSRTALERLATEESDGDVAYALEWMAALRAHHASDLTATRAHLRALLERSADDVIAASYLLELERRAGSAEAHAVLAAQAAAATIDPALAAALHLEASFIGWQRGDRRWALEQAEAAAACDPSSARAARTWMSWGIDPGSLDARRRALLVWEEPETPGASEPPRERRFVALERFATELAAGDAQAASDALARLDAGPAGPLNLAAALGRLVWASPAESAAATADALSRIAARSPDAQRFVAAERLRIAREAGDIQGAANAALAWFEAGGALPAALEWLASATALDDGATEVRAQLAVAASLSGEARESMIAGAALLQTRLDLDARAPLVDGTAPAVRLANLELAPPGCDPRRRAIALKEVDGALGDDAALDAGALAGWSLLVASDFDGARAAFEAAVAARPSDLAAWEGLRAVASATHDGALGLQATAELGARCADDARGAALWEEAAFMAMQLGDDDAADHALDASFARDPSRPAAFDKLFRRTRDRKDHAKVLSLVARRLQVTDDVNEIQKLCWEQARALREMGQYEAALRALEQVTILEPDHVGALALLGEINIRRGQFDDAAAALSRLATLETAPPKNRVTAAIAAVDVYENKLQAFEPALEVLLAIEQAGLATMPIRERLARIAGRAGAWHVATATLEHLMNARSDRAARIEAARLAMIIHRDRLDSPQGAAGAVLKLLSEEPTDGEAIDLMLRIDVPEATRRPLLEAASLGLAWRLRENPIDAPVLRRLADVAHALQDDTTEQAALGVLAAIGNGDVATEQRFSQLAARRARTPQVALSASLMASLLSPGDEGPVADLFVALGPTLAEALGPNAQSYGVGRKDRVDPRTGLALRNEIASWAGALGLREFDLYIGGKEPLAVQGIPGDVPALVVGASINAPLSPLSRARAARELLGVLRGTTILQWRDEVTVAAIVVAACRLTDVRVEHPPYAVLGEIEKLIGRALSRRTRRLIAPMCAAIAADKLDPRVWSRHALGSLDRVAVVAAGDPSLVLTDILGVATDRLGQAVPSHPRAAEVLRFVLSRAYGQIRRALGIEGAP